MENGTQLRERLVGGGQAAVHGLLQQHLLDVVRRERAVDERGAHVQAELLPAAEGHSGADHQQPPAALVEAGARPDLAPGVTRDQILEFGGEPGRRGLGAIDVSVAENGDRLEIVDSAEKIADFLPALEPMIGSGLVTTEKVQVIQYGSNGTSPA